jgi:hypothetical protein|tara:strand:- start:1336 stop:2298 length:963 start_codon:yes stop_codon:yes gene_type:complete
MSKKILKKLAIIISHCDSSEKRNMLREAIFKLKKIDLDILLFSHVPINKDIQDNVNYLILDNYNPILTLDSDGTAMSYWINRKYKNKELKLICIRPDYGWTTFNQFKKSGLFSKDLDYDYFYLVHYDMELNNKTLKYFKLTETNLLSNSINPLNEYFFPSTNFIGLKKEMYSNFVNSINKKDYKNVVRNEGSAESYLTTLVSNLISTNDFIKVEVNDLQRNVSVEEMFNHNENINDNFKIFFITHPRSGNCKIYIYEIKKIPIIRYNDTEFILENKEDIIINLPKPFKKSDNIGYELDNQYYDLSKFLKSDNTYKGMEEL